MVLRKNFEAFIISQLENKLFLIFASYLHHTRTHTHSHTLKYPLFLDGHRTVVLNFSLHENYIEALQIPGLHHQFLNLLIWGGARDLHFQQDSR